MGIARFLTGCAGGGLRLSGAMRCCRIALTLAALASPAVACDAEARRAEQMFGIPPLMLQAIIRHESSSRPLALNIDGKAYYPQSQDEAMRIVDENLPSAGNIDIGCGQISMRYHGEYFKIRRDIAFDPWINVVYASKVLLDNFKRHGSWTEAVARYHSGDEERQRRYLCLIMQKMLRLSGRDGEEPAYCRGSDSISGAQLEPKELR